jgi:hypothetical protein
VVDGGAAVLGAVDFPDQRLLFCLSKNNRQIVRARLVWVKNPVIFNPTGSRTV